MKGRFRRFRVLLQVLLVCAAIAALLALRQRLDESALMITDTMIIVCVVCFLTLLAINIWNEKSTASILLNDHNEKVASLTTKAQTDALTGLLNREAAVSRITQFLEGDGKNHRHALLMVDLDNFKMINDNFGHFQGDEVLAALSAKIRTAFRSVDIVGRLGGDEFIVLLKHAYSNSIIKRKAIELRSVLEYMYVGGDVSVSVTGSIGISVYDADGKNFEQLYKEADEALYRAKLAGKNKFLFFKEGDNEDVAEDGGRSVLRESSASVQLQAIMDNIDGGIVLLEIGPEIREIFQSSSLVRRLKLGCVGSKHENNGIFDFINKEDAAQIEISLKKNAETGVPVDAVFRVTSISSRTEWLQMRAVRIPYENSALPVVLAIITDVTNLKETELNYIAQKKQLETVLKLGNVITFEVDINKRALHVTDSTVSKYGIDTYVIENMPDVLIDSGAIHPDSVDECRRMYNEIYAGIPEGSAIIKTMKRSGVYTIERFIYFTVFDGGGRPVKAVGIAEGTETRSNELLRVELTERLFRNYSDHYLTIIKVRLSTDTYEFIKQEKIQGDMLEELKTYTQLLEYRLLSINPSDRQRMKEQFNLDALKKSFKDGQLMILCEYKGKKSSGEMFWLNIAANLYLNPIDGEILAYIRTRDISRRKKLELAMPFRIEKDPKLFLYSLPTLRAMTNAIMKSDQMEEECAIALVAVDKFDRMRIMYGEKTTDDMIAGIAAKITLVFESSLFVSYADNGVFVVLTTGAHDDEWFETLIGRVVNVLKNPAMFLFHEEDLLQYQVGYAIAKSKAAGFDELYAEAMAKLKP
jgi:diguanylate cyclase (GGDEF)-like protein